MQGQKQVFPVQLCRHNRESFCEQTYNKLFYAGTCHNTQCDQSVEPRAQHTYILSGFRKNGQKKKQHPSSRCYTTEYLIINVWLQFKASSCTSCKPTGSFFSLFLSLSLCWWSEHVFTLQTHWKSIYHAITFTLLCVAHSPFYPMPPLTNISKKVAHYRG